MWGSLASLCASWLPWRAKPSQPADGCKQEPRVSIPIGEKAEYNDMSGEMELGLRREASPFPDSPRTVRALNISSEQQTWQQLSLEDTRTTVLSDTSSPKVSRTVAGSVRFATSDAREHDQVVMASVIPSECVSNEDSTVGISRKSSLGWRGTRVRLLLPSDSAKCAEGGGGGTGVATAMVVPAAAAVGSSQKMMGTSTLSSKANGEPRALVQLASLLLAHGVDYHTELEEIITTHGSEFSKGLMEDMLQRHGIPLPRRHLRMIGTLYRVDEIQAEVDMEARKEVGGRKAGNHGSTRGGDEKIDGVALLKDLERAAFRHLALGARSGGPGGGTQPRGDGASAPSGLGTAVNSRKNLAPSGQLGDKARILQLVASQLATDESLRIRAGSGEDLTPEHLQEVVEQIDLTSVAVPVGTRAPYVPSTEDPDSFQVPTWSLRAMQVRKQQRDRALLGSDPHLRRLGQAGREALRSQLTSRSLIQQQEIIANAVVTAARAAVAPAVRLTENVIQLAGHSRMSSMQRSTSRSSTSPQRLSATALAATTAGYGSASVAATAMAQSNEGAARGGDGHLHENTLMGRKQIEGQLQSLLSEVVSAGMSCSGDSSGGSCPLPVVRQWKTSGSGNKDTARIVSSPSAMPATSSPPTGGSRSGSPLAATVIMGASSRKALDTAGSDKTIRSAKIMTSAQTSVSQTSTPSSSPHPAMQPPLPPPLKQQQDGEPQAETVLRQMQTHQVGGAGQEPSQVVAALVQGDGSSMATKETMQQVASRAGPPSPQGKGAWVGGESVNDCMAESTRRSTLGGYDEIRGDAGTTAVAAGIENFSADVSIRMSVIDQSGGEVGAEVGGLVPPASPCSPGAAAPLLLCPPIIGNEPQHMPEAGLIRSARGLEAVAQHRQVVKARSSCTRRPSNSGTYSVAHPSVSSPGLRSTNVDSDGTELPGQCNSLDTSSPAPSPPPASLYVPTVDPLLDDIRSA